MSEMTLGERHAVTVARLAILTEVEEQLERKNRQYADTGGDPTTRRGLLTCYLPYELVRAAFPGRRDETEDGACTE